MKISTFEVHNFLDFHKVLQENLVQHVFYWASIQPVQNMELQEKEEKDEKYIRELIWKNQKIKSVH